MTDGLGNIAKALLEIAAVKAKILNIYYLEFKLVFR